MLHRLAARLPRAKAGIKQNARPKPGVGMESGEKAYLV